MFLLLRVDLLCLEMSDPLELQNLKPLRSLRMLRLSCLNLVNCHKNKLETCSRFAGMFIMKKRIKEENNYPN